MRIEQYIQMINYALWEVIENGNTAPKTTIMKGVEKIIPPITVKEKAHKRLEVKARSTLMIGIPNEHYSKMFDQTFNRLQKLVSQLELLGETISQEDVNQKLLRSLLLEWNTHVVVWMNKTDLDTMSMDDLYNNLKVYEPEVKGMSSSINASNIDNSSDVVIYDLEEMDLRWKMAMLTMRNVLMETSTSTALVSYDGLVPPPYTGNFMPPIPDLSFTGLDVFVNSLVVENKNSDEEVSKVVRKSNDSTIIEDWVSDSEEENVSQTKTEKKTVKPSIPKIEFVKPKQQEKTARKIVKQVEKIRQNTHSPRGNQRN
ncbi:hypothetical protein Tco_0271634 [Tanacetum coccineum]